MTLKFRQFYQGEFHYWGYIKEGVFVSPLATSEAQGVESQQFIGLTDKNKKEIYDGDIVRLLCSEGVRRNNIIAKIVWDNERAKFIPQLLGRKIKVKGGSMNGQIVPDYEIHSWAGMHSCFFSEEYIEVIGNIHQNKKLLKK